jgi:hypothetical protein
MGKGGEAAAIVKSIKNNQLRDQVEKNCFNVLEKMPQDSDKTYDAMTDFVSNLIGPF